DRENVDQGRDATVDANGRLHVQTPALAVGWDHRHNERKAACQIAGNTGAAREPGFLHTWRHVGIPFPWSGALVSAGRRRRSTPAAPGGPHDTDPPAVEAG